MSKRHAKHTFYPKTHSAKPESHSPETLLARGSDALNHGYYADAINFFERAFKQQPAVGSALAEAYFRHAVAPKTPSAQQLKDLQRATELQPNDPLYYYHLGLAHHRCGELDAALLAYEIAAGLNHPPRGLPLSHGLAKIQADPHADLHTVAGLTEPERQILDTLAMLLRGDTSFLQHAADTGSWFKSLLSKISGSHPTFALWRGLGYLLAGDDDAAQKALDAANQLAPHAQALRHYYRGVIAAKQGDPSAARIDWEQARARGLDTPWLRANLAAVPLPSAHAALRAGNWNAAAEQARAALRADPANPAAAQIAAAALDRLAHAAAQAGNWKQAAAQWSEADQFYAHVAKSDATRRRILQNLAIAAERAELWEQAADAWRELLRTKPRGKKVHGVFSAAQWTWLRRRATQDLQKAGRLGDAITLMKQKIKQTPNDIGARLELVEALLANQQEVAAGNELGRILELEPTHTEARLKLAEWHARRGEWYGAESQVQKILEYDPANETAHRQRARLMQQRARSLHESGRVDAARAVIEEALQFAPNDAELYIDLGRAHLDLKQRAAAEADFEQAYRFGAKQISVHEQIARCWALERNLAQVKNAVTRAEQQVKLPPLFFVHLGLECQRNSAPRSPFFAPPPQPADLEWTAYGKALIEQGVALNPNDLELLRHVVMDCIESHTPIGMPYAERLTQLAPADPMSWITFAVMQNIAGDVAAAKKNLKAAARVARRIGNRELEQTANQLLHDLDNPLFSLMSGLGTEFGGLLDDFAEDEFEDEEFEDEDLFWAPPPPPSRKRRR